MKRFFLSLCLFSIFAALICSGALLVLKASELGLLSCEQCQGTAGVFLVFGFASTIGLALSDK